MLICSLALFLYSSLWVWVFCVRVSIKGADKSSQPYGISLIGLYSKPENRFLIPYVVDFLCSILFKVRCWYRWYGWQSLFKHFLFHNEMLWIFKLYQWSTLLHANKTTKKCIQFLNINCQLNSSFVGMIAKVKMLCIQEIFNIQIRKSTSPLQCYLLGLVFHN
jgi:hypothetical protein